MIKKIDENYMKLALSLAKKRKGYTHPNPTVGAVVVKEGKIIGLGYHERAGKPHAEVVALKQAGKRAEGSTLYVTLEPCTHFGRTPPCTNTIIKSGVKRVVVATLDPNPLMSGKGVQRLKSAGIEVDVGVCEEEARELNEDFFTYISKERPYVTLKWAQTIDGKLATLSGSSKWITSEESRKLAHLLRREATAVLVGVNTVIKDDPQLTVRHVPTEKQPIRIILDPDLKIPLNAKVLDTKETSTIVITSKENDKLEEIKKKGAEVLILKEFNLKTLMKKLKELEIMHLMVEGGAQTLTSFIKEGLFDRVVVFIAPKIMGEGISIGDLEVQKVEECVKLRRKEVRKLDEDTVLFLKRED